MFKLITQLLLLKWLSFLFFLNDEPPPDTWPGAGLHPQLCRTARYHSNWRWVGRAEWSESACDALKGLRDSVLWWLTKTHTTSSCVSEVASALQALEVGLLQDAVDLQVGHQVCGARKFWGVARAAGTAGAHNTLTGAGPSCMFWTADAALAVGWLRVPGIPARLRRQRMASALPFGLGHQVAALLITTTALPFPVFSQHMMTLNQSWQVSFVFVRTRLEDAAGWRYPLVNGTLACILSVDGLSPELANFPG